MRTKWGPKNSIGSPRIGTSGNVVNILVYIQFLDAIASPSTFPWQQWVGQSVSEWFIVSDFKIAIASPSFVRLLKCYSQYSSKLHLPPCTWSSKLWGGSLRALKGLPPPSSPAGVCRFKSHHKGGGGMDLSKAFPDTLETQLACSRTLERVRSCLACDFSSKQYSVKTHSATHWRQAIQNCNFILYPFSF